MASDRQIAANRRNAQNSTGPRSRAGKRRSSQNALRHELTRPLSGAALKREKEALARSIAGDTTDELTLALARDAAEAEFELARVRMVRVAWIERMAAFGRFDPAKVFASPLDEAAWIMQRDWGVKFWPSRPKFAVDPTPAMPAKEPDRTAEAVRRALTALQRLERFESRARLGRDRAIGKIVERMIFLQKSSRDLSKLIGSENEA